MPCNPSAPPVIRVALLASSESMAATTRVCISRVRPVVRRMMAPLASPTRPAAMRGREEAADRLAPAIGGEDAGRIGAGAEERGMPERDDAGIAQHQIEREREQDGGEDLRAQRQIVRKHEIGRDRQQPGQGLERPQAVPGRKRVELTGRRDVVGSRHQARPNRPRGRHSRIAMVSA